MTVKECAEACNDVDIKTGEFDEDFIKKIAENNLVIVYGFSDDLCEFRGAIFDEVDCCFGATVEINDKGEIIKNLCDNDLCPYFQEEVWNAKNKIKITPDDEKEYFLTIETNILHETFKVLDNGVKYCKGIVFSLNDIKQPEKKSAIVWHKWPKEKPANDGRYLIYYEAGPTKSCFIGDYTAFENRWLSINSAVILMWAEINNPE